MGASAFTITPAVEASDKNEDRVSTALKNIGLLSLKSAITNGWTIFDMIDGFADEFEDETGVASTSGKYDAATDSYGPDTGASFLLQSETTDGSETFLDSANGIGVTSVTGARHRTSESKFGSSSILLDGHNGTGENTFGSGPFGYLAVDFDSELVVGSSDFTVEFWYFINVEGNGEVYFFDSLTASQRQFRIASQANNPRHLQFSTSTDGSAWTTVGGAANGWTMPAINTWYHVAIEKYGTSADMYVDGTKVGTTQTVDATLFTPTTTQFRIGNGAQKVQETFIEELRFSKSRVYGGNFTAPTAPFSVSKNFDLTSVTQTANSNATFGRVVALVDPVDVVTLNTDFIIEITSDGGTNWDAVTLEYEADYDGTIQVWTSGEVALTGGLTDVAVRSRSLNDKEVRVYGWWLQWR